MSFSVLIHSFFTREPIFCTPNKINCSRNILCNKFLIGAGNICSTRGRYEKCIGTFRKKRESSRPLLRHAGKKDGNIKTEVTEMDMVHLFQDIDQ